MASNKDELAAPGTFDIRQVLAERLYPEDDITFYVDEEIGYRANKINTATQKLYDEIALITDAKKAAPLKKALAESEKAFAEFRQKIADSAYSVHVRAISRRAKFDINSKALHEFPIQRDLFGRDNSEQEYLRTDYITELVWLACIQSLTAPNGSTQEIDESVVKSMRETLPDSAIAAIDNGLAALSDDGDWWNLAAQDQDF